MSNSRCKLAERESKEAALSLVRRYCAKAKEKSLSPLHLACKRGDVQAVRSLLHCTHDMVQNESEDGREYMKLSSD